MSPAPKHIKGCERAAMTADESIIAKEGVYLPCRGGRREGRRNRLPGLYLCVIQTAFTGCPRTPPCTMLSTAILVYTGAWPFDRFRGEGMPRIPPSFLPPAPSDPPLHSPFSLLPSPLPPSLPPAPLPRAPSSPLSLFRSAPSLPPPPPPPPPAGRSAEASGTSSCSSPGVL